MKNLYHISASNHFLKEFIEHFYKQTKQAGSSFSEMMLFLPTRRSCRIFKEIFLEQCGDTVEQLPKLIPIGELSEEIFTHHFQGTDFFKTFLDVPLAIKPIRRHLLLTRLILEASSLTKSIEQVGKIASDLAALMDHIYDEGLSFESLQNFVPVEFAEHWGRTVAFLKILSVSWPLILKEEGVIDSADRRARLLSIFTDYLEKHVLTSPIYIIGSHASLPLLIPLMGALLKQEKGYVILNGLDPYLSLEEKATLPDSHPYFLTMRLLNTLDITFEKIKIWGETKQDICQEKIQWLLSKSFSPQIKSLPIGAKRDLLPKGVLDTHHLVPFLKHSDEAYGIALMMRESLEDLNQNCALVTPNKLLAKSVKSYLEKWDIDIDNSAGKESSETVLFQFLKLILESILRPQSLAGFLALLKHPYFYAHKDRKDHIKKLRSFEKILLRHSEFYFNSIWHLEVQIQEATFLTLKAKDSLFVFLKPILKPLSNLNHFEDLPLQEWLKIHIDLAEYFYGEDDENSLWQGEVGIAFSNFLAEFYDAAYDFKAVPLSFHNSYLETLAKMQQIQLSRNLHPRLSILGPFEGRLLKFDRLILGSLVEEVWAGGKNNPWFSNRMAIEFGLPSASQSIGMSAFDFIYYMQSKEVFLTYSETDQSVPTTPLRWLLKFKTLLKALGAESYLKEEYSWHHYIQKLHHYSPPSHLQPPAPSPSINLRPRALSVTDFELLIKDPYTIYAKHILKLKQLEALSRKVGMRERGTLLHKVFELAKKEKIDFTQKESPLKLEEIGKSLLKAYPETYELAVFWLPQFQFFFQAFSELEKERASQNIQLLFSEKKGAIQFKINNEIAFTLKAKADRLDYFTDGGGELIDYKTGVPPSFKDVVAGFAPQLGLEALIYQEGGFDEHQICSAIKALSFWQIAKKKIKQHSLTTNLDTLLDAYEQGVRGLLHAFYVEGQPYYASPNPLQLPKYSDYKHFSRVKEWLI